MKILNIYVNARKGWEFKEKLAELGFRFRGIRGTVSYTYKVPEGQADEEARRTVNAFVQRAKESMPAVEFSLKEYTTADRDAKAHQHPSAKKTIKPKKQTSSALDALNGIDPKTLAALIALLKGAA